MQITWIPDFQISAFSSAPLRLCDFALNSPLVAAPSRFVLFSAYEIVKGERALTADTALRLGRYFKMDPQFWLVTVHAPHFIRSYFWRTTLLNCQ